MPKIIRYHGYTEDATFVGGAASLTFFLGWETTNLEYRLKKPLSPYAQIQTGEPPFLNIVQSPSKGPVGPRTLWIPSPKVMRYQGDWEHLAPVTVPTTTPTGWEEQNSTVHQQKFKPTIERFTDPLPPPFLLPPLGWDTQDRLVYPKARTPRINEDQLISLRAGVTFTDSGVGGMVVGSMAITSATYDGLQPTGGMVVGGTATGTNTYAQSGIGGMVVGGPATSSATYLDAGAVDTFGGMVVGGTETESTTFLTSMTGGMVIGSGADNFAIYADIGIGDTLGGMVVGGTVPGSNTYTQSGTGGMVVGGTATVTGPQVETAKGGMVVGGMATVFLTLVGPPGPRLNQWIIMRGHLHGTKLISRDT